MTAALVALGSNLGDRRENLERAVLLLGATPGVQVTAVSGWHATRPIGGPAGQMEFLNGAALLETSLSPEELRAAMSDVETALGRERVAAWGPRTIDLDLLLFGQQVIETSDLIIPHPRMAFRRFVIEPAAEIAPDWLHPTIDWTMAELRDHLRDAPNYIAITGPVGVGKTALAAGVASAVGGRLLSDPVNEPAGRSLQSHIELLELREKQLARSTWPAGDQPVISDYWFCESRCVSELSRPSESWTEWVVRYVSAAAQVVQPKLLVWLEAATTSGEPQMASDPLRQLLWAAVLADGRWPLLRLDAAKPEAARNELAAAIDAMRP